jgi:hypothetical protein
MGYLGKTIVVRKLLQLKTYQDYQATSVSFGTGVHNQRDRTHHPTPRNNNLGTDCRLLRCHSIFDKLLLEA